MTTFLITRLPAHSKALEVIEFMQKNNFFFRLSSNSSLFVPLMSSCGGDSRLAAVMGLSDHFEQGDEENRLIRHLSNIYQVKIEDPDDHQPSGKCQNTVGSKELRDSNGKRKADGVPCDEKHSEVKRRKKTGERSMTISDEKQEISGMKALVKEEIVEEPAEGEDRRDVDQVDFAAELEKFRQRLLTIASSIPFPFAYEVFSKLYQFKHGGCLLSETKRFGYGSFEEIIASIPEIRADAEWTFSWIGKWDILKSGMERGFRQHEIGDLEEVRAKIVEVVSELGNRAAIGAIENSYLKNYGESIPFENLGYKKLKSLLSKHPMLEQVPGRVFRLREKAADGEKTEKEGGDGRLSAGNDDVSGKEKKSGDGPTVGLQITPPQLKTVLISSKSFTPASLIAGKLDESDKEGTEVELGAKAVKMLDEGSE